MKGARTDKFHDRFIIIDDKDLYHCGASIKDLGKKCFAINKMEDEYFIEKLKEFPPTILTIVTKNIEYVVNCIDSFINK